MAIPGPGEPERCAVCGGGGLRGLYEARDPRFPGPDVFKIAWCDRCGVATTLPRLSSDALLRFYPDDYDPYREELRDRTSSRVRRSLLRAEERFAPGATDDLPLGSLLDVGCGNGQYMEAMARRGFTVAGVEISRRGAERVAARGLRVTQGDFLAVDLTAESFDIVTMNHYLEHSLDPRASLLKARELLRPSGRLVVGVPNFSSWARGRFGARWSDLDVPRHVSHFTPEGLARLLAECGFHPDRTRYEAASDSGSIVASLLAKDGRRSDAFLQRLSPFLHLALYPVGLPLAALRRSAWIRVFATKS